MFGKNHEKIIFTRFPKHIEPLGRLPSQMSSTRISIEFPRNPLNRWVAPTQNNTYLYDKNDKIFCCPTDLCTVYAS